MKAWRSTGLGCRVWLARIRACWMRNIGDGLSTMERWERWYLAFMVMFLIFVALPLCVTKTRDALKHKSTSNQGNTNAPTIPPEPVVMPLPIPKAKAVSGKHLGHAMPVAEPKDAAADPTAKADHVQGGIHGNSANAQRSQAGPLA